MRNILAFVGHSGSGKTVLIQRLTALLSKKGYRVGVLKHTHGRIKVDRRGTDTDRFRQAGAALAAISDDRLQVRFENVNEIMEEIDRLSQEVDVLLVEGYKSLALPKVLLISGNENSDLRGVIATYGIKRVPRQASSLHFSRGQEQQMAEWIAKTFISPEEGKKVRLNIDGRELIIKDYVARTIAGVVAGLVRPLKGGRGRKVAISIDFGKKI